MTLRVLHISTSDILGGAAKAAFRLHQGLRNNGIKSFMLVQEKNVNNDTVYGPESDFQKFFSKFRPYIDRLPLWLYGKSIKSPYHVEWLSDSIEKKIKDIDPDIIHLHWVCGGFVNLKTIRTIKKPIVWTLHDMWPFTGGCHYSGDCKAYTLKCGCCPQLGSKNEYDLSRLNWRRKRKWDRLNIMAVSPSRWIGECAKESSLFKNVGIDWIPNGIDFSTYKPGDKNVIRNILNLPVNKKIILSGAFKAANDVRKGFSNFKSIVEKLDEWGCLKDVVLVFFGKVQKHNFSENDVPTRYFDYLHDDISLSLLYAAADVFVLPTTEDNLPNTILEALACGTPCVSFEVGGVPEMIQHKKNGYLAQLFNVNDLSHGIRWVLEDPDRHNQLCSMARTMAEKKFDLYRIASRYEKLYHTLI